VSVTYRFVPGFKRRYRVGDDGSIWSYCVGKRWRRLRPGRSSNGYLSVHLRRDGKSLPFLVHQLVLLAFVGPCPDGMETRHVPDPDRDNNRLSNLRYGTRTDNYMDWVARGGSFEGSKSSSSKLTEDERDEVVKLVAGGLSQEAAGKRYGICQAAVSKLIHKRTHKVELKEIA
jgi:HNH endonuclease